MPYIQIISFPASDALQADPALAKESAEIISAKEGLISAWMGFQVEDSKIAYLISVWTSPDAHEKLKASPEFPRLQSNLKENLFAGPPTFDFVELDQDHTHTFEAPYTRFGILKTKDGQSKEEVRSQLVALKDLSISQAFKGAHHPAGLGELVGKPGSFITLSGWDSPEGYGNAAASDAGKPAVAKLIDLADRVSVAHVQLRKYKAGPTGIN
ncbi:hypothetical protein D9611_009433 [Ephemerocybe angulata]|uniref:Uncharacterized protein n=2 Tax=Ephemerocybe angulata TaxID=980116 RepID=A0A8H6I2A2_9AGAR|nr:hypothetical protein D9611_009433 [Tulosesus angulatus]KAF6757359.1 hypothetical protein DFP72DRAFT_890932 [Tulosesus angulatus]